MRAEMTVLRCAMAADRFPTGHCRAAGPAGEAPPRPYRGMPGVPGRAFERGGWAQSPYRRGQAVPDPPARQGRQSCQCGASPGGHSGATGGCHPRLVGVRWCLIHRPRGPAIMPVVGRGRSCRPVPAGGRSALDGVAAPCGRAVRTGTSFPIECAGSPAERGEQKGGPAAGRGGARTGRPRATARQSRRMEPAQGRAGGKRNGKGGHPCGFTTTSMRSTPSGTSP